ncbi:CpaD family pilus assembly lipoprotein [Aureimonas sp. SK2]|uniref:CpaD family pilus assembly protein n=1 Tax=Aureimonas sp. SK2 TaxID=3015992 RepID=UPI002443AAF4|nr:CpaD family pilus assembly lipoprotein [Aureimonas sp. SK2]
MSAHAISSAARRFATAGFALATLSLAGCAQRPDGTVNSIPDDYRVRHPIIVGEAVQDLDILVASSETRLTHADVTRVESFATRFRSARASVMRIQVPAGARNGPAAEQVARDMVRVLGRQGVPRSRIIVSPYDTGPSAEALPIRLSFSGISAGLDHPCGEWPEDLGNTYQNRNYQNFGCASQANLAAQIADPRDLLGPRGMGEIDAERRTKVIQDYRSGEPTASRPSRTESRYDW